MLAVFILQWLRHTLECNVSISICQCGVVWENQCTIFCTNSLVFLPSACIRRVYPCCCLKSAPFSLNETVFSKRNDQCMQVASQGGLVTREAMWNAFTERCRKNLHIVLAMSPVGEDLRRRCRNFPALVNNCVIDWFDPWPTQALQSVAGAFLQVRKNICFLPAVLLSCKGCAILHIHAKTAGTLTSVIISMPGVSRHVADGSCFDTSLHENCCVLYWNSNLPSEARLASDGKFSKRLYHIAAIYKGGSHM